jgi:drug/metabolite transporter (DMT)-like permease
VRPLLLRASWFRCQERDRGPLLQSGMPGKNNTGDGVFSRTHFLGCVGGIYASFLIWGWLQERLTKMQYGEEKQRFTFITFLNLVQYAFACIVARSALATGLAVRSARTEGWELHRSFILVAFTNSLGSLLGYASLNYISFPLHILAKSCKLIPVMCMGAVINGKRYSTVEILSVLLITIGLCVFASKPSKDGRSSELFGIALVFANLSLDGVTNALQDTMYSQHTPSPHEFMYLLNFWSVLLLFPCAFYWVSPGDITQLTDSYGLAFTCCVTYLPHLTHASDASASFCCTIAACRALAPPGLPSTSCNANRRRHGTCCSSAPRAPLVRTSSLHPCSATGR